MSHARYHSSVRDLFDATRPGQLSHLIKQLRHGNRALIDEMSLTGEEGSWVASLPTTAEVLMEAGLGEAGVLLEYNPHQAGNGRADLVVTGMNGDSRAVVVVELKQWSQADWDAKAQRATNFGARYDRSRHPYQQAADYAAFIANYTEDFHPDAAQLSAAAFLHNANEDSIQALRAVGAEEGERTFSGDPTGRDRFVSFLKDSLDPVDGTAVARDLLRARFLQSANILKIASRTFQDPDAFPLTPEQSALVDEIITITREVKSPTASRNSAIIVVNGAPGSGKTWICLHLIGRLANAEMQVAFATNSTSLRETLSKVAREQSATRAIAGMITSARTYWKEERWTRPLDLLIVDEAQRISEFTVRSGHANPRHVQQTLQEGQITQLFELKKSADVLVLMIDEGQATTASDHLTTAQAKELAERVGADFFQRELTEQHRSGGSKEYEAWVDALVADTPIVWSGDDHFTVELASTPEEMEQLLESKDAERKRILAGFSWPWETMQGNSIEDLPQDVRIGEWSRPWNLRKPVAGLPGTSLWAYAPEGAGQVGSVFTAQGFEFDYCAVIIGPDMKFDDSGSKLEPNPAGSEYKKLVQATRNDTEKLDYIRNQYRVLLTRAMKGVVIYATDPEVRELLAKVVEPAAAGTDS